MIKYMFVVRRFPRSHEHFPCSIRKEDEKNINSSIRNFININIVLKRADVGEEIVQHRKYFNIKALPSFAIFSRLEHKKLLVSRSLCDGNFPSCISSQVLKRY